MTKEAYPGLDAIRFFAALMVALYHLSFFVWSNPATEQDAKIFYGLSSIGNLFTSGYVGVPIFFVLSGFVIAFTAERKDAFGFFRSRVLRLLPPAWICATITTSVLLSDPDIIERYLHSVALWPAKPWVDGSYWTLAVEITFYGIVLFGLAYSSNPVRCLMLIEYVLGIVSSAFWILRLADFVFGHNFSYIFDFLETKIGNLVIYGCHFSVGMIIWYFTRYKKRYADLVVVVLCLLAGVIANGAAARYQFITGAGPRRDMLVVPLIWLFSVLCIAALVHWNSALSSILPGWRLPFRTIGLATYPLYLVHQVFGRSIIEHAYFYLGAKPAFFSAMLICAAISFMVIRMERYPRKFLSFLLDSAIFLNRGSKGRWVEQADNRERQA